ncbi:uncharacterized protein B0H18DRAFT_1117211 [Fomitopsis serialis]|uniref:uncharacterized protein n=1 Tax=Fomitopsis serialis TaxID=139415 RepID=UPI0020086FA1|nr:uncharacterized protein B0H18DRAFT_1117211 [Neoantrodia serialis]KAH9930166.1 hypothetical protein B0H18DRAFT_1117211 [Neoantrodia serialis]
MMLLQAPANALSALSVSIAQQCQHLFAALSVLARSRPLAAVCRPSAVSLVAPPAPPPLCPDAHSRDESVDTANAPSASFWLARVPAADLLPPSPVPNASRVTRRDDAKRYASIPSTKLPFAASPPAVARTQQHPRALVVSKSHHRGQTIDGLPVPIIATADDAHQSTSCASS